MARSPLRAVLLVLLIAGGAAWVLSRGGLPESPIAPGREAPGFELPRVGAPGAVSLAELRGRVVLVNFWATWCGPCEQEMPAMQRLWQRLGSKGFELLAVSEDDSEEPVLAYRERLGLSFPILLDRDRVAADRYQTHRYPESFLVDRDGVLVERYVGPRDWDDAAYVDRIERLLAPPPAPAAAAAPTAPLVAHP